MKGSLEAHLTLRKINRLDASRVDANTLQRLYKDLLSGVRVAVGLTSSHELFFRARVNPKQKPTRIGEIGAPPAEFVVGFQRCNQPHQPMLYFASRRITALMECRVEPGDKVYLSQWMGLRHIPVNKIFDSHHDKNALSSLNTVDHIVYSHLDTIFTRKIHKDYSEDYKFSATVAGLLTRNFRRNDEHDVWEDGLIGIRYPSVLDISESYNTAFDPSFALERVSPIHIMELEITRRDGESFSADVTDNAIDFENGEIHWLNNATKVPALRPKDRGVIFQFNNGRWGVLLNDGPPSKEYIDHLLLE